MKIFHLIGNNISTSLSPSIHNSLFKLKGFSGIYSLYQQNTKPSLTQLYAHKINGLSITIPFKQSYSQQKQLTQIHNLSQKRVAEKILAKRKIINTIRLNYKSGKYQCSNTDIFGVRQCLQPFIKSLQLQGTNKQKESLAVIIGGGSTAEVFMAYFYQKNIPLIVFNRTVQKIKKLNQFYPNLEIVYPLLTQGGKKLQNLQTQQLFQNVIIINTLPTSLFRQYFLSQKDNFNLPQVKLLKSLCSQGYINKLAYMDVNYRDKLNSLQTFIKNISKDTNKQRTQNVQILEISTGLDMLIWQAIQQNRLFCCQDIQNFQEYSIQNFNKQQNLNRYQYLKKCLKENI